MAFRMYLSDHADTRYFEDGASWTILLESYTGPEYRRIPSGIVSDLKGIRACPGYMRLRSANRFVSAEKISYGWNWLGLGELRNQGLIQNPGPLNVFREDGVANPSEFFGLADALITSDPVQGANRPLTAIWPVTVLTPFSLPAIALWPEFGMTPPEDKPPYKEWRTLNGRRHGGRFNTLFCDGHLETLKPRALFDIRQDQVLRKWNRDFLPHHEALSELP